MSRFQYSIENLVIQNLFELRKAKTEGGGLVQYPLIKNIFDFEYEVFKPLFYKIDAYFGDLSKENFDNRTRTFNSFSKYRKSIYDFVYKSQMSSVDGKAFDEMVFDAIFDDIKEEQEYGVKNKLNIWYSIYNYFNPKSENMVSKLKGYQDFVATLIAGEEPNDANDEKFAFAAGQVIKYLHSKSKSADKSYSLLEPYLQQANCTEFKKAIANDFDRYKHETFSRNFERVAAFVLSYETNVNLKKVQPQLLSGIFANNQLFSNTQQQ